MDRTIPAHPKISPTDQTTPKVSVIIVNYNGGEWLARCVQSVVDQTLSDFECFIVDNGSEDGSLATLPDMDDRFTVIEAGENLGFAVANNRAAAQASAPWLALLNPDAFARPNWLEALLAETSDPFYEGQKLTMVGSLQYTAQKEAELAPKTFDGAGDFYHVCGLAWRGFYGHRVTDENLTVINNAPPEVFGPCAAAALYHRETFMRLGGFDERFFCYHEDVDLAFRMRLDGGLCIQSKHAIVDHVGSGITGTASEFAIYHGTRNRIWTFAKNMPASGLWILAPIHIGVNIAFLIWALFRKGRLRPTIRGIIAGLRGLPMIWRSRSAIHAQRKVTLGDLLRVMSVSPKGFLTRGLAPVSLNLSENP